MTTAQTRGSATPSRPGSAPPRHLEAGPRVAREPPDRGRDAQDHRVAVALTFTNLDAPLFADAGATKGDLVDYLDAVRDRLIPELRDRPLSVIRVVRGQRPFMQKNLPTYAPPWVRSVSMWAEASKREVSVRTLQRPAHPALVRQPARGRVPPGAGAARPPRPRRSTWCSTSTRRSGDDFPRRRSRPHAGARRRSADAGLDRGGQDQRRQGRARLRAGHRGASHEDVAAAARGIAARAGAARPLAGHHGVHEGPARRQCLHRRHPGRRGDRGGRIQPAGCAPASRCRSRSSGMSSTGSRLPTSPSTPHRSWPRDAPRGASYMPPAAASAGGLVAEGRAIPVGPRAGDARGQAPRSHCSPNRLIPGV